MDPLLLGTQLEGGDAAGSQESPHASGPANSASNAMPVDEPLVADDLEDIATIERGVDEGRYPLLSRPVAVEDDTLQYQVVEVVQVGGVTEIRRAVVLDRRAGGSGNVGIAVLEDLHRDDSRRQNDRTAASDSSKPALRRQKNSGKHDQKVFAV